MYEECITCSRLGKDCDGPNCMALSAHELVDWIKARKRHLGWTNQQLADRSGTPRGTIDRLLSHHSFDFKHDTIRPIVIAVIGDDLDGNPCPISAELAAGDSEKTINYQRSAIDHLKKQNEKDRELYQDYMKEKRRTITILSVLLGVAVTLIIGALFVDAFNPNIGFFWMR